MDLQNTPLWDEIEKVMEGDPSEAHARWRCELIVDGEVIEPHQLISIETVRQYVTTFADQTVLAIKLMRGTYYHRVLPFKDDFKVTLYREPVTEVERSDDFDSDIVKRTYRGVLVDSKSEPLKGNVKILSDEDLTNRTGFEEVSIQLVDLALEQLQMKSVGGIYRDMTVTDVVQGTMTKVSGELSLADDESVQGVDMVEGMNDTVRDHIVVPNGTRFVEFPKFIQESIGVYGSGIGYYLQNGIWYVYPEFNTQRFDSTPKSLTVVNIPQGQMTGIERTYLKDGDRVTILATGRTDHLDESDSQQLTLGNGVHFASADKLLEDYRQVDQNRVTFDRSQNIEALYVKSRRAGLNQAPMSPRRITANPYRELSDIATRMGSIIQFQWQYADADLLYPGMPVRYVYLDGDTINEVYGIILGADHLVTVQGRGMLNDNYVCEAVVRLFLET